MTGFNSKKTMANDKLEDLMYQSGLTAQGCWDEMDEYDREAIIKLAELVKEDTIKDLMSIKEIIEGADINSGDGGYSIGTEDGYKAFAANRNK